jgi:hypothetical protein
MLGNRTLVRKAYDKRRIGDDLVPNTLEGGS